MDRLPRVTHFPAETGLLDSSTEPFSSFSSGATPKVRASVPHRINAENLRALPHDGRWRDANAHTHTARTSEQVSSLPSRRTAACATSLSFNKVRAFHLVAAIINRPSPIRAEKLASASASRGRQAAIAHVRTPHSQRPRNWYPCAYCCRTEKCFDQTHHAQRPRF